MAASQARLLSITARLTNNENTGQSISYSKQRLADQTQQITNEYNEALDATKLTVLTSFNGAQANYEDISYNLMTGMPMAESMKQYIVTDTKGKILVTNDIANAYEYSRGDYNRFLAKLELGYSQSDLTKTPTEITKQNDFTTSINIQNTADGSPEEQIHQAWDRYFQSVGLDWTNKNDPEHEEHQSGVAYTITFATNDDGKYIDKNGNVVTPTGNSYQDMINAGCVSNIGDGYASYKDANGNWQPINYEGTTQESRDLYDYAMALTEKAVRNDANYPDANINTFPEETKTAANPENSSALKYYKNIFNKIMQSGYFTYTNKPAEVDQNHLYTSEGTGTKGNVQKNPLKDNYTFEGALRDGTLRLEYYSSTDKAFKSTTLSEDNCIQEVADERAIAKAESKYNQDMADLENKDKKLDLELKKLDTEHNALQTEYDSVKNVVDKNVESSFKIFS